MKAQYPRKRRRKRKCKCCGELYLPDARHFHDQQYCSEPGCRKASKRASQRKWLMSEKGAEYRDPEESKRRVREWRVAHPDYAKLTGGRPSRALQETRNAEHVGIQEVASRLSEMALQEMSFAQPALIVGLMAHLTGSALQETIVETSRRFVLLGQDILGNGPGSNPKGSCQNGHDKTSSMSRASPSRAQRIQLDRPSVGA